MNNIDSSLINLKQQIDRLKIAVDKCHIPSIYVHTYKIASIVESTKSINLTDHQKVIFGNLDNDAIIQFERLSKGRCSCSIADDI